VAVAIKSLLQPSSFFSIRNNVNPLLNPPPQYGSQYVSYRDSSSSAVECWTIGVCSECSKLGAAAVHDYIQNHPPRPTRDGIDFGGGKAVAVGGDDGGNGGEGGMPPQENTSTTELAAVDGFGMQEPSPKELAVMEEMIARQAVAAFAAAEIELQQQQQQQQQQNDHEVVDFKQELHNKVAYILTTLPYVTAEQVLTLATPVGLKPEQQDRIAHWIVDVHRVHMVHRVLINSAAAVPPSLLQC
jgi:hypothetical protein